MQQFKCKDLELDVKLMKSVAMQHQKDYGLQQREWFKTVIISIYYLEQNEQLNLEENSDIEENSDDDDGFPKNNYPSYINALYQNNCSNEQILRFDCGRLFDLKIKNSSFLENGKGLFADCDIPEGIIIIIM